MNGPLVLGALLAALCVVVVALPFVREPQPASDVLGEPDAAGRRWLELAEERDRALSALKELEADHRGGVIGDADYRATVGVLRREAAAALKAIDAETGEQGRPIERRT